MDIKQDKPRNITVSEMAPHVHSFLAGENKVDKISNWLENWIKLSLDCGKIKPLDFLPSKGDLACHIGVSLGTMQNVFRRLEDIGLIESKQKIGTYINNRKKTFRTKKLTSKRELAVEIIKKYILENHFQKGDRLTSIRQLANYTGIPITTIRLAIINLVLQDILKKENNNFIINKIDYEITPLKIKTLAEKIAENIQTYISEKFNTGEKIPSNAKLAEIFNVSIKTIHDSLKILAKGGYIHTRRGKYGTIVLSNNDLYTELYEYEKIEQKIRQEISLKYKIGDKLPSIKTFSKYYNTSEKTIKKALDNLAGDGYITFSRGRYGGTFILDIPQTSGEAYKWLAINTDFIAN